MKKFKSLMLCVLLGGDAVLYSKNGANVRVIFVPHDYDQSFQNLPVGALVDGAWEGSESQMFRVEKTPVRWSEGKILIELKATLETTSSY